MTRAMESGFKAWLIMRSAHPAATAAASRLDHHRVAKLLCDLHRIVLCLNDSIAAGRYRHAGFARSRTSSVLVAHRLHRTRGRADELDIAAFADFHEMRVLSEEPIAGMNRINIADLGRAHDPIDFQITLRGWAPHRCRSLHRRAGRAANRRLLPNRLRECECRVPYRRESPAARFLRD